MRRWNIWLGAAGLVTLGGGALAQHAPAHERMLDSVVYVECVVEYQGDAFVSGFGTGFLAGIADRVITNNHVIENCNPENRIAVLKERVKARIINGIKQSGKLPDEIGQDLAKEDPDLQARVRSDRDTLVRYIEQWVDRQSTRFAKQNQANITQKLAVVVMGKGTHEPTRVDVNRILWNSQTSSEQAKEKGIDLAILALTRPLHDHTVPAFATGSSAQIGDTVYTVGFPGASSEAVTSVRYVPTIKRGIVSKLGGESPYMAETARAKGLKGAAVIETDAAISPGNSGGPLFNEHGEVLGINTFGSTRAAGVGWAQDIEVVLPVLQDLGVPSPAVRRSPRTWFDDNRNAVFGAAGAALALTLIGVGALVMRRRHAADSTGGGPSNQTVRSNAATRVATARLLGRAGQFKGTSIPVPSGGLLLGREAPGAHSLTFSDDSDISRRHCRIDYDPGSRTFRVTDQGSSNGTFVLPGETRLTANRGVECQNGQLIRLGNDNIFELSCS